MAKRRKFFGFPSNLSGIGKVVLEEGVTEFRATISWFRVGSKSSVEDEDEGKGSARRQSLRGVFGRVTWAICWAKLETIVLSCSIECESSFRRWVEGSYSRVTGCVNPVGRVGREVSSSGERLDGSGDGRDVLVHFVPVCAERSKVLETEVGGPVRFVPVRSRCSAAEGDDLVCLIESR